MLSNKSKCAYPETKVWYEELGRFGCKGKHRHEVSDSQPSTTDSQPSTTNYSQHIEKKTYINKNYYSSTEGTPKMSIFSQFGDPKTKEEFHRPQREFEARLQQKIDDAKAIRDYNVRLDHELNCLPNNLVGKYQKNITNGVVYFSRNEIDDFRKFLVELEELNNRFYQMAGDFRCNTGKPIGQPNYPIWGYAYFGNLSGNVNVYQLNSTKYIHSLTSSARSLKEWYQLLDDIDIGIEDKYYKCKRNNSEVLLQWINEFQKFIKESKKKIKRFNTEERDANRAAKKARQAARKAEKKDAKKAQQYAFFASKKIYHESDVDSIHKDLELPRVYKPEKKPIKSRFITNCGNCSNPETKTYSPSKSEKYEIMEKLNKVYKILDDAYLEEISESYKYYRKILDRLSNLAIQYAKIYIERNKEEIAKEFPYKVDKYVISIDFKPNYDRPKIIKNSETSNRGEEKVSLKEFSDVTKITILGKRRGYDKKDDKSITIDLCTILIKNGSKCEDVTVDNVDLTNYSLFYNRAMRKTNNIQDYLNTLEINASELNLSREEKRKMYNEIIRVTEDYQKALLDVSIILEKFDTDQKHMVRSHLRSIEMDNLHAKRNICFYKHKLFMQQIGIEVDEEFRKLNELVDKRVDPMIIASKTRSLEKALVLLERRFPIQYVHDTLHERASTDFFTMIFNKLKETVAKMRPHLQKFFYMDKKSTMKQEDVCDCLDFLQKDLGFSHEFTDKLGWSKIIDKPNDSLTNSQGNTNPDLGVFCLLKYYRQPLNNSNK